MSRPPEPSTARVRTELVQTVSVCPDLGRSPAFYCRNENLTAVQVGQCGLGR